MHLFKRYLKITFDVDKYNATLTIILYINKIATE